MRGDLSTAAGVLRFCEDKRAEMVRCFERVGRFEENGQSFCAYLFATHEVKVAPRPRKPEDWKTGPRLERVSIIPCRLPSDDAVERLGPGTQKDLFASVVNGLGKLSRALGYVLLSETWMKTAESLEERQQWPASLEFAPGRREALFMNLEHTATGRKVWKAEILREPTRLLEWESMDWSDVEGRFVNLVEWRS